MIAALLFALDIVFVKPDLPPEVRWQAVAAEVLKLANDDDTRVAVVDETLRVIADFTNKPETIRHAILSRETASNDVVDLHDKLVVVATFDRRIVAGGIPLPLLVIDTSRGGELVPGIATKDGVQLHPRTTLARVAELMPKTQQQQTIVQKSPQERAMQLFVEALRRLQNGDDEGVEVMLSEVIATDPLLADAWFERGMLAAAREDHEAAKRDLAKYLALDPRGKHAADAREFLRTIE